jgi:hypothetical protein
MTRRDGVFSEASRGVNHKAFVRHDRQKLILSYTGGMRYIVVAEQPDLIVGLYDIEDNYLEQTHRLTLRSSHVR